MVAVLFTAEFLSGIGLMWLDILAGVLQGGLIPRWVRSRVSGAFMVVKYGVRPPGTTIAGVLGTTIGVHKRRSMREAGLAAAAVDQLDAVAVRLDTEVD